MRLSIALVAVSIALAGCTTTDDGTDGSVPKDDGASDFATNATSGSTIAWGLADCQAAIVFFDVPADAVRPHLPEGYEPVSAPQGMTGVADPVNDGSFGIELFTCASGTGLDGDVTNMTYGSFFAFVTPPDDVRVDADYQFYKWDTLVPDTARREVLAAAGLPVVNGTVAWTTFENAGTATTFDGTLTMGGAEHTFSGNAAVPNPNDITFTEYQVVDGGTATWHTQVSVTAAGLGRGTVTVADGTVAADILGVGAHEGNSMAGVWSFVDGVITLP